MPPRKKNTKTVRRREIIPSITNDNIREIVRDYLVNKNKYIPIGKWNVTRVTNMSKLFWRCTEFNDPLTDWDTHNVVDMEGMFQDAKSFNQPLNHFNTSNVYNMKTMFAGAKNFNQPLNNWDTSNVTNMRGLFGNASSFNQPLNSWNTSNVRTMAELFLGASSFNQPLNSWDTHQVTDMSYMFNEASSFNQNLSSWNTNSVTNFGNNGNPILMRNDMFSGSQMTPNHMPVFAPPMLFPPQPPPRTLPEQPLTEEQRQIATELITRHKKEKEKPPKLPTPPNEGEYPFCCVCGYKLNNIEGPSEKNGSKANDVIRVCGPNARHFIHRECAIRWKDAGLVDIAAQMGNNVHSSFSRQAKSGKCPVCVKPMENLENAPKVDDAEILRVTYNDQKAGKRGSKTKKRNKHNNRTRKQKNVFSRKNFVNKNKRCNTRRR